MAGSSSIPTLMVEGSNDLHVICALVKRHGVALDQSSGPVKLIVAKDAKTGAEGVVPLLATMSDAIRNATDRPIGFVLDTDLSCVDRWKEVCQRLASAKLSPPASCPAEGYIEKVPSYPHSCGVWMMPDCVRDHGKLEHLLETLVPKNDPLWRLAETSTDHAVAGGAEFSSVDLLKAKTHCWLAWQREPGVPFGRAVASSYFGHDSVEAIAFLRWLKKLFDLNSLTLPPNN